MGDSTQLPPDVSIYSRNNIHIEGAGTTTMLFAHGFGCDQNMWRFITPAFVSDCRVVLFDHVGAGKSNLTEYRQEKYATLQGYADDVLEIIEAVGGAPVIFVGHSVSSMIGVVAAAKRPDLFAKLILIGPSACYINDSDYVGGFDRTDIETLLATLDSNYLGWSTVTAPLIMGHPDRPELADELSDSFCRTNPEIAKAFARVTFLSDNRRDLAQVRVPTLVMQCSEDVIAPDCVGQYVHDHMPESVLVRLAATGHCPHMSAPQETITIMQRYVSGTL